VSAVIDFIYFVFLYVLRNIFSFATLKAIDDHSGMLLPGNPLHRIFANNTAYHDFHHQLRGAGCNYAQPFFVSWDRLMGTYVSAAIVRASHGGLEVVPAKKRRLVSARIFLGFARIFVSPGPSLFFESRI
jgi:sterol desaturase/sphingolipid hydroxylase (fatty acid hydroxylase superfamily)